MPLVPQNIPIDFDGGLDTKTDEKHVLPGRLLVLENAVRTKNKRLEKRPGYRALPARTLTAETMASGDSLAAYNDEALVYAGQRLYSYSPGSERFADKGAVVSAIVKTKQVIRNTAQQSQADSATNGGLTVYAWEDSRGGVRASVYDETTGAALLEDKVLDASASRARCVAFKEQLFVFYYKSGTLYARSATATAFGSAVTVSSTVNTTNPVYDVYDYEGVRLFFAHAVQGASEVLLGVANDQLTVTSSTTISEAAVDCVAVMGGPSGRIYVAYHNTNGVRCSVRNNAGGQVVAPFAVENPATDVKNITGYVTAGGASLTLLYETAAASTYNTTIRKVTITPAGAVGTPAVFMRSVGLWSKCFTYTDGDGTDNVYVGVVHSSTLQATFFVARSDGLIVAKQQYSLARGLTSRPILANVWSPSEGVFSYALVNKTQLVSENAKIFSMTGVARTSVDFTRQEIFTAAQLGKNLHIVGGVLNMYDGGNVVEHGFHLYPENVSVAQSGAAGVADGVYQYVVVYEWTDNYGQLHRSAPSVPVSFTVTGGPRNVTVTIPTLRLTAKNGTIRSNVSLAVYRTEAAGEIFYRVSSVTSPTLNDTTADTVAFVDTTTDANLISNEILYTTGGTLDNFAAPACSSITTFQNRVVLGGLEKEDDIWFSKEVKDGQPVEFSDELKKTIDAAGGGVSAVAVVDSSLIFFKKDRYYFTYGIGPNNAGQDGDFAEPQEKTAEVGCDNPSSIVKVLGGLMLKSAKGIYLIDAGLNPSYIGAEVEAFNDLKITSAVHVSDNNQVRFTTETGALLVYDYTFQQWSTFTGLEAKDAVMWRGSYLILRDSGVVWQEDPSYFKDAGAPIKVRIGLGWLALGSVVGYQRVRRFHLLGEYKSPHKLRVGVAYDFSTAVTDYVTFDPDTDLAVARYGDGATYGADAVYGGENIAYRFEGHLRKQKCSAIRFVIEELTTAATEGAQESFNITTLGLEVGVKAGMAKLKPSQMKSTS